MPSPDDGLRVCCLCNGTALKLTSPSQWKNEDARRYAETLDVTGDHAVCPACRKDITRVLSDSSHVPRWTKSSSERECCVQMCAGKVYASYHKTDSVKAEELFHSCGLVCSTPPVPVVNTIITWYTTKCSHAKNIVRHADQP